MSECRQTAADVFVVLVQQPTPQNGVARLEVFRDRDAAVAYLRAAYERFRAAVPGAPLQSWSENPGGPQVAAGVVDAGFTSWSGSVVARSLDFHPVR